MPARPDGLSFVASVDFPLSPSETEGSPMKAKVEKRGGELILKIPKRVAKALELEEGTEVELARLGGSLLVTPSSVPSLEDLLEQVTEENLHGEIETGPPVGREIW